MFTSPCILVDYGSFAYRESFAQLPDLHFVLAEAKDLWLRNLYPRPTAF